ncbi:MAG: hypothetical protein QXG00_06530 [Candidatus Woesearchaeota archaeon]
MKNLQKKENYKKLYEITSKHGLILCNSYEHNINGMITFKNCLVKNFITYNCYYLKQDCQLNWYNTSCKDLVYYNKEDQIVMNREDVSIIKSIDKTKVPKYITKEEVENKAKKLENESKAKAEAELKEKLEIIEKEARKNNSIWNKIFNMNFRPKKSLSYIEGK